MIFRIENKKKSDFRPGEIVATMPSDQCQLITLVSFTGSSILLMEEFPGTSLHKESFIFARISHILLLVRVPDLFYKP